jgi:hypothetical protein
MKPLSFGELAESLEAHATAAVAAAHTALKAGAELVKTEAQAKLGHYQGAAGDTPAWAPLSEATQADRVAKGFTPDDPLLRTGELRDSIEIRPVTEDEIEVGVFDGEMQTIAAAMEFGYHNVRANKIVAPRSFIRSTAFEQAVPVGELIEHAFNESME